MLDADTMALLTGAAGNIVAYLLYEPIDAVRTRLSRIFKGEADKPALDTIHADITALTNGTASQDEIRARWSAILASHLAMHPEARDEIASLASEAPTSGDFYVGAQHNYNDGTFIGRDNYGPINRPTSRGDR